MTIENIFTLMSAQKGEIRTRPDNGKFCGEDDVKEASNDNNPLVFT